MAEFVASLLLITGVFFVLTAAVGILRLPDTLCRAHALSKALTFGISLMLLGLLLFAESIFVGIKIIAAIGFQFLTIPLAGHIFGLYAQKKRDGTF